MAKAIEKKGEEKAVVFGREYTRGQFEEMVRGHERRNATQKRLSAEARELAERESHAQGILDRLLSLGQQLEGVVANGGNRAHKESRDIEIPDSIEDPEEAVKALPGILKAFAAQNAETRKIVEGFMTDTQRRQQEQESAQRQANVLKEIQRVAKEAGVDWRALYFEAARDTRSPLEELADGLKSESDSNAGNTGGGKEEAKETTSAGLDGSGEADEEDERPPKLERVDGGVPPAAGKAAVPEIGSEEFNSMAAAYLVGVE